MTKKIEGEKEKVKRIVIKTSLLTLVGKSIETMSKEEKNTLLVVLGQMVGILDETKKVKSL